MYQLVKSASASQNLGLCDGETKVDEMGGACSMYGGEEKYTISWEKFKELLEVKTSKLTTETYLF
jgi:hypothetical protein